MDVRSTFGFTTLPFTREFRVEHTFKWEAFDESVDIVQRAISKKMSACLVGGSGLGKTVCLRKIASKLPSARYDIQYVHVTGISRHDLCRHIARLYKVPDTGNFPRLFSRLQTRLFETHATGGQRPVLLLDEAQDLRPEGLEWIRLLTNFEMDSRLVLSVVLAGLPALAQRLKRQEHAAIARRINSFAALRPMGRDELTRYVQHRCVVAGAKTCPFEQDALDAIYEIGQGNLSATDTLCLHALELAAAAKQSTVSADHILRARQIAWP